MTLPLVFFAQFLAEEIVGDFNGNRADEVGRIASAAAGIPLTQLVDAELMWVDRFGCYVRVATEKGEQAMRVPVRR